MKKLKIVLATLFTSTIVSCAFGQNNFFAGVGAGVNTTCSKEIKMFSEFSLSNNLGVDAFVGTWLTNTVGLRAGYRGISTNVGYGDDFTSKAYNSGDKVNFNFFHCDVMLDVINCFKDSKKGRIYSICPYAGAGVEVLKAKSQDVKTAICAGIFNSFRMNEKLCFYLTI